MNNIDFKSKNTPSLESRILLKFMKLLKMKSKTANMLSYVANILPVRPHNRLIRNYSVKFFYQNGKCCNEDLKNEKTSKSKFDYDTNSSNNTNTNANYNFEVNISSNSKLNYNSNIMVDYEIDSDKNIKKNTNNKFLNFPRLNLDILKPNHKKGRKVWVLSLKNKPSNFVVLFLHGGSYFVNITIQHWYFIELLAKKINATFVVPDYPLAPKFSCKDIYTFLDSLYENILTLFPEKKIIFMGDSAGGGLALGFAQKIKNEWRKNPDKIILFSPWLDITLSNPYINLIDKYDVMLSVEGLQNAGKIYAGDFDLKDYRVSPIYGNFENLGEISIFTGTHDILYADTIRLKNILQEKNINFNYFEYPSLFHDFMIFTNLPESHDVIKKVQSILLENEYSF